MPITKKFSKSVLENIKLPGGLVQAVSALMQAAEVAFGSGTGAQKKAWVTQAALALTLKFDIKAVPNWIETPAKKALIGFMVEVLWSLGAQHGFPGLK